MADTLLEMKLSESNGGRSTLKRTVIVSQTITFYNLHRAIQFCIKPRQSDSTVDGKAFALEHAATKKAIKAPKTAQLHKHSSNSSGEARIGDAYIYTADDKRYPLEITDRCRGDGRYYVPRCVAGKNGTESADLNAINGKLMVRKFSKIGSGQKKHTAPAIISSEPAQLNEMKKPLRFWKAGCGWWMVEYMLEGKICRSYLVEEAIKAAGPAAAAEVPCPGNAAGPAAVAQQAAQDSARAAVQEPAAAETGSVPTVAAAVTQASSVAAGETRLAAAAAVVTPDDDPVAVSDDATKTAAAAPTAATAVLGSSQAGQQGITSASSSK